MATIKIARMVAAVERVMTARAKKKPAKTKPAAEVNPLLRCGRKHEHSWDGWTTVFADRELTLAIDHNDVRGAVRRVPDACVVALAIVRCTLGPYITGAEVGTNITKLWSDESKIEVRFHTSDELGKAIRKWDKTGRWILPNGAYWLRRYPDSLRPGYRRAGQERAYKSVQKKVAPSRTVLRLDNLRAVAEAADELMKQKKK